MRGTCSSGGRRVATTPGSCGGKSRHRAMGATTGFRGSELCFRDPLGMARITGYLRHQERRGKKTPPGPSGLTPRQAVGLLLVRPDDRTTEEQQTVKQLRSLEPEVQEAVALLEGFIQLLRDSPHD